jgi:hypothetical protein
MIQTRNLNIDPQYYIEKADLASTDHGGCIGIPGWVSYLTEKHPHIFLGYFNPPHNVMSVKKCN